MHTTDQDMIYTFGERVKTISQGVYRTGQAVIITGEAMHTTVKECTTGLVGYTVTQS